MKHPLRSYACEDCGTEVIRSSRPDRAKLCLDCGIARVAANAYRRAAGADGRRVILARQRVVVRS